MFATPSGREDERTNSSHVPAGPRRLMLISIIICSEDRDFGGCALWLNVAAHGGNLGCKIRLGIFLAMLSMLINRQPIGRLQDGRRLGVAHCNTAVDSNWSIPTVVGRAARFSLAIFVGALCLGFPRCKRCFYFTHCILLASRDWCFLKVGRRFYSDMGRVRLLLVVSKM